MKKDIGKIFAVTIIAVFIRIICTPIFGGDPISTTEPFGNIAGLIGIIPAVIIMFFISYLHLTLVGFYVLRKNLAGNYTNGLIFGFLFGLIWLYGMFEAGILKEISPYKEFIFGVSEAIPIIILGILISYLLRNEKTVNTRKKQSLNNLLIIVIIISSIYVLMRYVSYSVIHIESKHISKPLQTLFWTLGNGILISLLFVYIRPFINNGNIFRNVVVFGIIIFGVDWVLYNMFVPVFFNVSYFEIFRSFILRSLIDIIGICMGVYITELFLYKKNHLTNFST